MPARKEDTLAPYDPILASADTSESPWRQGVYLPDHDLLHTLVSVPVAAGYGEKQTSGRIAKALDAWIAHELRRAGFPADAVSPRARNPRVVSEDTARVETQIDKVLAELDAFEALQGGKRLRPAALRNAIRGLAKSIPGGGNANVLGRFYVKQVDVLVSAWQRGPDVMVSSKSMLSSYLKNKNNRYEEAVGEAKNLRDRYPMAGMGYAYLVRSNIYEEGGAYAFIRDLLIRLRKPDGIFDATMLLVAEWDDATRTLTQIEDPADELTARRFFENLLGAVMDNTPVEVHKSLRLRRDAPPPGGLPPSSEGISDEDDEVETP